MSSKTIFCDLPPRTADTCTDRLFLRLELRRLIGVCMVLNCWLLLFRIGVRAGVVGWN